MDKRKNCRMVEMPDTHIEPHFELRSITCGILRQDLDRGDSSGGKRSLRPSAALAFSKPTKALDNGEPDELRLKKLPECRACESEIARLAL